MAFDSGWLLFFYKMYNNNKSIVGGEKIIAFLIASML
jgi:hypothetical protein